MKFKSILSIIIFAVLFFAAKHVYSADKGSIDVVLVMDSSGSMKKTDPQSLRIPAARLFISLLKDGDRASVISFSGEGDTLINLTPVDSRDNKEKLFAATKKITSRGRYTNLHGALTKGMKVLAEAPGEGRAQIIILMSDGMMDVGDMAEDSTLVERIRTELSVTLEESGIKVYTIAFTENSDRILLERISKRTGGFYNLTLSDQDFHVVFTSIFESLKSPEMLPMSKNGFKVDSSVEEVTIVATKGSSDTKIMLNAPDGQSFTSDGKYEGIEWFLSNKFDMITVENPIEGRWEILFSTGENNKAYIITDLQLKTNFEKLYSTYGEPREVQIWLEKEGNILNEPDILDKVEFLMELTAPDGRTTKLKPFSKGDGTYVRSIAPFSPGNYSLRVITRGKTFERTKEFVFNVANIQESKEDIKHDREKKQKQAVLRSKELEEEAAQAALAAEQNATQEEKAEEFSWWKVIGYFVGINLVIGLGILAFFKIRKSKKARPPRRLKRTEVKEQKAEEKPVKADAPKSNEKGQVEAAPAAKTEAAANVQDESTTSPEKEVSTQTVEAESNAQESTVQQEEEPVRANDKEIALDDMDSGTPESKEAAATKEEKTDMQADNQKIALEDEPVQDAENKDADIVPEQDGAAGDQGESENLMSQDDLDSLLAGAPERESDLAEEREESGVKEKIDNQDVLPDAPQVAEDVKQSADEEVAGEDTGEAAQKTETEKPERKAEAKSEDKVPETKAEAVEEPAKEEAKDEENVDDMWAEAFKEAEGEKVQEQKAEAKSEDKVPEAKAEAVEEPAKEEAKDEENVDDMWAEAFKEAEGQEIEDKEPDVSVKPASKEIQQDPGEDPANG